MKKIILATLAAAIAVPAAAAPGDTDTAQGTANAEIIAPITLTHDTGAALDFGTIVAGAGTVTVTSAGVGSDSGADAVLLAGSTTSADSFSVSGDESRSFSITTTGGNVTDPVSTESMSFTTSASAASGTLDASGDASFTVGGTLTVGATQAAGSYTGSYDATVTYN